MAMKKARSRTSSPDPVEDCVHHWEIEAPSGAVSAGTCRNCGETREFRNSIEFTSWYRSRPTGPKAK